MARTPTKKTSRRKSSTRKAPARKAASAKSSGKAASGRKTAAAKKTTARKTATRKPAARKTAARKTTAKKAPAKKAPARKTSTKKAPARKSSAKKAPARKTSARKAPARKASARKAPAKRAARDKFDHRFKAIYDHEVKWESDDVRGLLTLPEGVQVKVLNYDPVMKRLDMKQRFPKGYVEPRHTHKSWHSIMVLDGRMCVAGKDLRRGDYVFGWDIPHGPYEYPDGCEVFIVYMGDASHIWDEEEFLAHQNIWKPETDEGRQGTQAHIEARNKAKR